MRSDTVFKGAFNRAADLLGTEDGEERGGEALSETRLGQRLGVSRTTARKVLAELAARGLVAREGAGWRAARAPGPADRFPEAETTSRAEEVERRFMEWLLREDPRPGALISELDLARRFGVATSAVREFLARFSRHGLVEKRPNSGWLFRGFDEAYALELFEVRALFEMRSARAFAGLPEASPLWARLDALRDEHVALAAAIDARFHDFPGLDNRFHLLLHEAAPNRFVDGFQGVITLIFHYHYQWRKADECDRNLAAIGEHLLCIDALRARDRGAVEAAFATHLASARRTLLRSLAPDEAPPGPGAQV